MRSGKMSEKRFQKTRIVDKWGGIYDSETDRVLNVNDVEHKLNEQQGIIEAKDSLLSILSKENEKLKTYNEQLGEQQAIIRKLQDLCGESDSENAKLRIENEQLKNKLNKTL